MITVTDILKYTFMVWLLGSLPICLLSVRILPRKPISWLKEQPANKR